MNPNLQLVAAHWPNLTRLGLITVAMPASDFDLRSHNREAQMRDLARRKKKYAAAKKKAKKKKVKKGKKK